MVFDKHNWFEKWFNTVYYHLLYDNRSFIEADNFITTLVTELNMPQKSRVWDLACGKGRHAIALNKNGLDVIGTDLSEESITVSSKFENDFLHFYKLDMRSPFRSNYFDYVLNLFTSFGYFSTANDDLKVFKSISTSLKPNGLFVFDYLNKECVVKNIELSNQITKNDVVFTINKKIVENKIIKQINVMDKGSSYDFCESVKLYNASEIIALASKVGLLIEGKFGNYKLDEYDEKESPRMILFFRKK